MQVDIYFEDKADATLRVQLHHEEIEAGQVKDKCQCEPEDSYDFDKELFLYDISKQQTGLELNCSA